MKIIILVLSLSFFSFTFAQNHNGEKAEINKVVQQFKESIIKKDSVTFYSLFHENPVVWIGLVKDKTQQKRVELNPANTKNFFRDTYEIFFRGILEEKDATEEKFEDVQIINDEVIASVTFNYSFWFNNKMTNWGREIWHLIKVDGKWKITSVVYSYELTKYYPKPK